MSLTHAKPKASGKISSITIAFNEPLQTASAVSTKFYQVAPVITKRKKVTYGKQVTGLHQLRRLA